MNSQSDEQQKCSRRSLLTGSAALLVGGALGSVMTGYAATAPVKSDKPAPAAALPLPWKWSNLDPLEAGRRAYRNYAIAGCGHATYMAFLSLSS